MLRILGRPQRQQRYCDGLTRRNFLQIGGLALGGMSLPELLRAEHVAGVRRSHKAVIMIYLCGGPPHQDMYDIKADAPSEIRGPFAATKTNVPGLEICEHLPQLARIMDKLVPIRSMVGAKDAHYSYQCMTGHHDNNPPAGGWPHFGAAASLFRLLDDRRLNHRAEVVAGVLAERCGHVLTHFFAEKREGKRG